MDRGRYQRLVGRLIYRSHTRPDIGFAVSMISQYMNKPTKEHMKALTRFLRYLKMTPGKGLLFKKNDNKELKVYTDADWAGDVTDWSTSPMYLCLGQSSTWRRNSLSFLEHGDVTENRNYCYVVVWYK